MLIRNITKITNDSFKKLNEDVNELLLEDIDAVKKVFMNRFPDMSDEEFDEIINLDPTYKDGSNSVGKYGKWLLGLYKNDYPLDHPLYSMEDIYNILNVYDSYKNDRTKKIEKDINKFKSIDDLTNALENVEDAELSDRQKERELRNSKDVKKIFEDSTWEIWIPQSFAGSCTLGKGTTWCTAYSDDDSYYKQYTSQGPLYIFINKQNPKEKYQLHVETESFMNKDDEPASLKKVLNNDKKLKEFVYTNIYGYKTDVDGNFIYDGNNRVPKSVESVIVEQGVTEIKEDTFALCKRLQSITIPDSVMKIGGYAFNSCYNLKSIIIPNSVIEIDGNAFQHCYYLESVVLSNLLKSIEPYTFYDCVNLKSITIPNSVTKIGNYAFDGCGNLKEVILENPNTKHEDNTFPEHTKIIKKGVNENMKIRKNESINLRRAKKLLENKGYVVRRSLYEFDGKPNKMLRENDNESSHNETIYYVNNLLDNLENATYDAWGGIGQILTKRKYGMVSLSDSERDALFNIYMELDEFLDKVMNSFGYDIWDD